MAHTHSIIGPQYFFPNISNMFLLSFSCKVMTLCDLMDCSTPGFSVLHHLPELAQTHVHWVDDAIQPSHHLTPSSPLAPIFPSIRIFSNESYSYTSDYNNSRPLAFPQKYQASPWRCAVGHATSNAHHWLSYLWIFYFSLKTQPPAHSIKTSLHLHFQGHNLLLVFCLHFS